ncbi:HET-domain-containing protein [Lophium mytilinum]|uniref:HET-domain-containing protein n=1 Tax=Lophium mytilinum TaxID=390894 RepID=A0A6A6QHN4_9PEZI|nr:HET-domain-containing protein [Lophium mytilinum]
MANLCSACAQIRFLDLCCPTAPDIHSARKAQKANLKYFKAPPFRVFSAEHSPPDQIVPLGSLGQIRRSSTQCSLCYLIHRVIRHRGAYILGNRPIQDDDDNIIFFAITGILASYGNVTESMSDTTANGCPDKLFDFRRLCLTVHFKEDTVFEGIFVEHYRALAFYNHIAQVCHVDSFEGDSGAKLLIGNTASEFENPRMLFSGRKRPDTVDIKLLRNWMSICNTEHTASCCEESESEDIITPCKLIRLIHVDHLCLHVLRDVDLGDLQYAALSYVWGGPQPVILEKGNEDHFQRKDALSGTDLPQTILDAIHLARLLQIKYLWVDALCIFQGGSPSEIEDRQYQLSNMGNIYRAALVTIIAACGANSNAGLSGLRPGSRSFVQEIVQLVPSDDDSVHAGLGLVTTCTARPAWTGWGQDQDSFHDDIDISAWNTRAWTFQERCLARRSLVFTPEQVFWVCDEAFFCEESSFEDPKLYKKGSFDMPLHVELYGSRFHPLAWKTIDGPLAQMTTTRQNFWTRYSLIVQEYSSRKLTCPGDIFDAFEKIEEAFHRISGETFQWGHPKSRFGVSLAWTSPSYIYTLLRRSATTTLPMTSLKKTVVLPSWSWMGWMGVINLGATDERLEW